MHFLLVIIVLYLKVLDIDFEQFKNIFLFNQQTFLLSCMSLLSVAA